MSDGFFAPIPLGESFGLLDADHVAERSGTSSRIVRRLYLLGAIESARGVPGWFEPETTLRVRRILRLRHDLRVNVTGAAAMLDLLDRIESLEARLRLYEGM